MDKFIQITALRPSFNTVIERRVWLEPGEPLQVDPCLTVQLKIDEVDGGYEISMNPFTGKKISMAHCVVLRAIEYDESGKPLRALAEISRPAEINRAEVLRLLDPGMKPVI